MANNKQPAVAPFHDLDPGTRRLRQELSDITAKPPPLCSASIKENDIRVWTATIQGPPDSVYEGGVFELSVVFPKNYPFNPPHVKFETPIYHCNVSKMGDVCLDILKDKWTPAMTLSSLLISLNSLMTDPNPYSALQMNVAFLYLNDRGMHDEMAREFTRKFAFPGATDQSDTSS